MTGFFCTSILRDKVDNVFLPSSSQGGQKLGTLVFRYQQIQKRFASSVRRSPLTANVVILSASQHSQAAKLFQQPEVRFNELSQISFQSGDVGQNIGPVI